ncbi:MAG: VWA domain-containing protein [Candidatus Tantalella remota]|nr:VWA domain-containing protein [Candidatus Tantalella remota]
MTHFANPLVLLLIALVPPLVYLVKRFENKRESFLRFSNQDFIKGLPGSLKVALSRGMIYLKVMALMLFIAAAARPLSTIEKTKVFVEGVDIVLTVDTSSSMRAMDFEVKGRRVDRLEAVKKVVLDFIKKRPNDRIGMVAFSAQAYTVCPLTLDHDWLEKNVERVQIGMIEDGTAIGSAISGSLNRVKDTDTKEKIVILLTDGRNNAGRISPLAAAEAARAIGVSVYTIGAGTKGMAPYPVKDMYGNTVLRPVEIEIDEKLLRKIAEITGGEYFRATDTRSLAKIYDRIDQLEKTKMEETGYNIYRELFMFFLIPGMILLFAEMFLSRTILRRIP